MADLGGAPDEISPTVDQDSPLKVKNFRISKTLTQIVFVNVRQVVDTDAVRNKSQETTRVRSKESNGRNCKYSNQGPHGAAG